MDRYHEGFVEAGEYRPYGNEMAERALAVRDASSSSRLDFSSAHLDPSVSLQDVAGSPLCSVDMSKPLTSISPAITSIRLPVPAQIGSALTDFQVRHGIAYVSADPSIASDADLFVIDISSSTSPGLISSIDSGPGISAIALAGRRVYAAALSSAAQLHVIRFDGLSRPFVEARFKIPLPYATATPPLGSAISYRAGKIYLGTEKWDGPELSIIDASVPGSPRFLGGYEFGSRAGALAVSKNSLYVGTAGQYQFASLDVSDPAADRLIWTATPSGWQRQQTTAIYRFEASAAFGRTSGGFDIPTDHEAFIGDDSTSPPPKSANISGGVYGVLVDRSFSYFAVRRGAGELVVFDRSLSASTSRAFALPGLPERMTCEGRHLYVLAHGAPFIYDISF